MSDSASADPRTAFSELQLSALAEAGNIGSGHAAKALAQLLGRTIMLAVTKAHVLHVDDCPQALGGCGVCEVGVESRVLGDMQGGILVLFARDSAARLAGVLMGARPDAGGALGEMEQSTLKEACSIVSAAYLNALSDLLGLCIIPSVHRMLFDHADALVRRAFGRLRRESTLVIGVETEFREAGDRITGYFFFMPDRRGVATLLQRLGMAAGRPERGGHGG